MKKSIVLIFLSVFFISMSSFARETPKEKMARKLKIIIPKVRLQNVTAEQALAFVRQLSRDMDPEGEGVNIIYFKGDEKKKVAKK